MNGIQLLLLAGICFIGLYFFTRLGKRLLDIVLLLTMIACSIVFIVRPEITNMLAKAMGVGRGADLIFYISILIFWLMILKLYARIRKLDQTITHIIRENALKKAEQLPDHSANNNNDDQQ